jgi:hypothetical protein
MVQGPETPSAETDWRGRTERVPQRLEQLRATTPREHERRATFSRFVAATTATKKADGSFKELGGSSRQAHGLSSCGRNSTRILATYKYEYGGGNDCHFRKDRLSALMLQMCWSGLSIKDAVTLERSRLDAKGSLLLHRAETGGPCMYPCRPMLTRPYIRSCWTTRDTSSGAATEIPISAIKGYQRSFWKLFKLAEIKHADGTSKRTHPHMFRD